MLYSSIFLYLKEMLLYYFATKEANPTTVSLQDPLVGYAMPSLCSINRVANYCGKNVERDRNRASRIPIWWCVSVSRIIFYWN